MSRKAGAIHPLWALLSSIDWEGNGGPLSKRFKPTRSPNNIRLFQMASSTILAFMAKHGYSAKQLYEAYEDLVAKLIDHIEAEAYKQGLPFDDYVEEKLALKRRQYNTGINDPAQEEKRQQAEIEAQARAYRKESDG